MKPVGKAILTAAKVQFQILVDTLMVYSPLMGRSVSLQVMLLHEAVLQFFQVGVNSKRGERVAMGLFKKNK